MRRGGWGVTKILRFAQNDRVFRLTMTGLEPLAARPIGASAKKRAGLPTRSKVGARPVIICPCTGVRLDARPGQGRPRGAVRRSRTGASAKKRAGPAPCHPERSEGSLEWRKASPPLSPVTRSEGSWEMRRGGWGVTKILRFAQNDRVFRLTMTGLEPLAARPIGASAKKHARKSCNLSWNWIFVLIIRPCKGADRRPAFPARSCRSAENAQPSHGAYHPGRMPRQGRSSGPDAAGHEARTKLAPGMKLNSSMRISSTISRSKRLLTATLISSSIISRSTSSSAAKSRSGSE